MRVHLMLIRFPKLLLVEDNRRYLIPKGHISGRGRKFYGQSREREH